MFCPTMLIHQYEVRTEFLIKVNNNERLIAAAIRHGFSILLPLTAIVFKAIVFFIAVVFPSRLSAIRHERAAEDGIDGDTTNFLHL